MASPLNIWSKSAKAAGQLFGGAPGQPYIAMVGTRDIRQIPGVFGAKERRAFDYLAGISEWFTQRGVGIVTGGAVGADEAAMVGAMRKHPELLRVYMPWKSYKTAIPLHEDVQKIIVADHAKEAYFREIATQHHPAWARLSRGGQALQVRNVPIIEDARVVLAWPSSRPGGGGTGHGMRVAMAQGKPLIDLSQESGIEAARQMSKRLNTTLQEIVGLGRKIDGGMLSSIAAESIESAAHIPFGGLKAVIPPFVQDVLTAGLSHPLSTVGVAERHPNIVGRIVGIARGVPTVAGIRPSIHIPEAIPSSRLLGKYKEGLIDWAGYKREFAIEMAMSPKQFLRKAGEAWRGGPPMVSPGLSAKQMDMPRYMLAEENIRQLLKETPVTLACWEASPDLCHRGLVGSIMRERGFPILNPERYDRPDFIQKLEKILKRNDLPALAHPQDLDVLSRRILSERQAINMENALHMKPGTMETIIPPKLAQVGAKVLKGAAPEMETKIWQAVRGQVEKAAESGRIFFHATDVGTAQTLMGFKDDAMSVPFLRQFMDYQQKQIASRGGEPYKLAAQNLNAILERSGLRSRTTSGAMHATQTAQPYSHASVISDRTPRVMGPVGVVFESTEAPTLITSRDSLYHHVGERPYNLAGGSWEKQYRGAVWRPGGEGSPIDELVAHEQRIAEYRGSQWKGKLKDITDAMFRGKEHPVTGLTQYNIKPLAISLPPGYEKYLRPEFQGLPNVWKAMDFSEQTISESAVAFVRTGEIKAKEAFDAIADSKVREWAQRQTPRGQAAALLGKKARIPGETILLPVAPAMPAPPAMIENAMAKGSTVRVGPSSSGLDSGMGGITGATIAAGAAGAVVSTGTKAPAWGMEEPFRSTARELRQVDNLTGGAWKRISTGGSATLESYPASTPETLEQIRSTSGIRMKGPDIIRTGARDRSQEANLLARDIKRKERLGEVSASAFQADLDEQYLKSSAAPEPGPSPMGTDPFAEQQGFTRSVRVEKLGETRKPEIRRQTARTITPGQDGVWSSEVSYSRGSFDKTRTMDMLRNLYGVDRQT